MFDFIKNLGLPEVIIILLIFVVLFGSKKITKVAKTAGETKKEIDKAKKEYHDVVEESKEEKPEGGV